MIHYISWIWQSYWWKWFLNVAWVRLSVSLWFQNFLSKLCIPFASFFIHCYLFFAEFLVLKSQGDYSSVCTKNCKHIFLLPFFSSAQSLSHMWLCNPMDCSMPGLFTLMPTESVMPSNHLILGYSLLLPLSIFPSTRVFSNESTLHVR